MTKARILMVIAPKQFRDEELLIPRKLFEEKGWSVETVSTQTGPATGMLGATENIQHTLEDIVAENYHALVIVGGMGSIEFLWHNKELRHIVQTLHHKQHILAAICLSGAVLANAGVLQGKNATVWESPESLEAFKLGEVTYTGQPVTVDGFVITANGPEAAEAFAKAVIVAVEANMNSLIS